MFFSTTQRSRSLPLLALVLLGASASSLAEQVILDSNPTSSDPTIPSSSLESPQTESLKLFHRFTYPRSSNERSNWVERGELEIDLLEGTVEFSQHDTAWEGVELPERLEEDSENELGGVRYELSIRQLGQLEEDAGFVGVRACQLIAKTPGAKLQETIVLHSSPNSRSFNGFKYSIHGAQDACTSEGREVSPVRFEIEGRRPLEIKIEKAFAIPRPSLPEQAQEQTPVQIDKEGKVVPPPKPKSFIQKYWLYIVPVLIVLMMGGGAEDEQKGGKK